jgi:hypothetical protein
VYNFSQIFQPRLIPCWCCGRQTGRNPVSSIDKNEKEEHVFEEKEKKGNREERMTGKKGKRFIVETHKLFLGTN